MKSIERNSFIYSFSLMFLIVFQVKGQASLAVFAERMEEQIIESTDTVKASQWLATQLENGSWKDVQYRDDSRTQWKPMKHLDRLEQMAVVCNSICRRWWNKHVYRLMEGVGSKAV